jgi:hypothetical protein
MAEENKEGILERIKKRVINNGDELTLIRFELDGMDRKLDTIIKKLSPDKEHDIKEDDGKVDEATKKGSEPRKRFVPYSQM